MRRSFLAVATTLMLVLPAAGTTAPVPPDREIREATEKLHALVRQNHDQYRDRPATFYAMVDEVVVPHFDQKYIGQIVLGRSWRNASEPQRSRFVAAFKNSLVHSYADAVLEHYDSVKISWKPLHVADDATEATVGAELQRENKPAVELGFSVHLTGGHWKVYDVVVGGISLAANFRSQFTAEVKRNGLDALIARLEGGGKTLQDESALKRATGDKR